MELERNRDLHILTDVRQDDGRTAVLGPPPPPQRLRRGDLETALRRGAKLATLDRKLATAAAREGVSVDAG